ncbi:hypothetical protein Barb4_02982 [Bacteroidales bacterium Barb4]|nr:hypothetical protein Barb4_02982 [Bacteroidales bacterium Barb4]
MKRKFNFLVTALLLFAASGNTWADKAYLVKLASGAYAWEETDPAAVNAFVVTTADDASLTFGGTNTGYTEAAVTTLETALGTTEFAKVKAVYKLTGATAVTGAELVKIGGASAVTFAFPATLPTIETVLPAPATPVTAYDAEILAAFTGTIDLTNASKTLTFPALSIHADATVTGLVGDAESGAFFTSTAALAQTKEYSGATQSPDATIFTFTINSVSITATPTISPLTNATAATPATGVALTLSDGGAAATNYAALAPHVAKLITFAITQKELAAGNITIKNKTYTGAVPTLTFSDLTNALGASYTLVAGDIVIPIQVNSTNISGTGTATIEASATGNYSGSLTGVSFTISPADLADLISTGATAVSAEQTVVEAAIETALTAKGLAKGTDYTIGTVPALADDATTVSVPLTAGTANNKVTVIGSVNITVTISSAGGGEDIPGEDTPNVPLIDIAKDVTWEIGTKGTGFISKGTLIDVLKGLYADGADDVNALIKGKKGEGELKKGVAYTVKDTTVNADSTLLTFNLVGINLYTGTKKIEIRVEAGLGVDYNLSGNGTTETFPIKVTIPFGLKRTLTKADFGDDKYYVINLQDATGLEGIAIDAFGPNVKLKNLVALSSESSLRGSDSDATLFTAYVEKDGKYSATTLPGKDTIVISNHYAAKRQEPTVTLSKKVGATGAYTQEKQTATVSWKNGNLKDAGTYLPEVDVIKFAGVNRFFNELVSFEILPFPLQDQLVFTPKKELVYNGQEQRLERDEFTLTTEKTIHPIVLTTGDYDEEVVFTENVRAGQPDKDGKTKKTAKAVITITNPNFTLTSPAPVAEAFKPFEVPVYFAIEKALVDDAKIRIINKTVKDGKIILTGSDVVSSFGRFGKEITDDFLFGEGAGNTEKTTVSVAQTAAKKEVKIVLTKNSNLKFADAAAKFITLPFDVVEKSVNALASKAEVTDNKPTFTGTELRPTVKIANLTEDIDFKVVLYEGKSIGENITGKNSLAGVEAGDYVIWVEGLGEYGEHAAAGTFKINKANVATDVQWHTPAFTGYETPEELLKVLKGELIVGDHKLNSKDYDVVLSPSTDGEFYSALITGTGTNFTGTHTLTFNEDSKIETVTSVPASVSYANGVLTLTNLNGATATVVSLNGKIAAKFTVSGNEVQKAVSLTPGFYILNAGNAATKFIVR